LITPVDGETSWARGGVDASLTNDGFEHSDGFLCTGSEFVADREFLHC
jgi:hypothetical protein